MEKKCLTAVSFSGLNLSQSSSSVESSSSDEISKVEDLLLNQPSTSRSSMSLLTDDFGNSQHEFAEVLDEETTTSEVLDTFEISSSNSLPTCSDDNNAVVVAVDDSSSTDTIKIVESPVPPSCNNQFGFDASEVYVINDDDDDDDDDVIVESVTVAEHTAQMNSLNSAASNHMDSQLNSVIMSAGPTIFLETPIVDEQQHHQQMLAGLKEYAENANKPKRLSDELLLGGDVDSIVHLVNDPAGSSNLNGMADGQFNSFDGNESPPAAVHKSEASNVEALHDRVSFHLHKMNINNSSLHDAGMSGLGGVNDMPSGSQCLLPASMVDIESMDLIERRDFETEQRLTGGMVMKASSFMASDMMNLGLIKTRLPQHNSLPDVNDDFPSSSSGRVVSSDSKCAYKDLSTTPTSSRNYNSRLTKSTAKINLRSPLSQHPVDGSLQHRIPGIPIKLQLAGTSSASSSATTTSNSSVIVEAPSTSSPTLADAEEEEIPVVDLFSNSNSNDSVTITISDKPDDDCQEVEPDDQIPPAVAAALISNGCSRTSPRHLPTDADNRVVIFDDPQPSTSSARCHYAPQKMQRVHASAQTYERYLARSSAANLVTAAFGLNSSPAGASITLAANALGARRRLEALNFRNSNFDEIMAAHRAEDLAAANPERGNLSEDSWADCEEINSDLEERCTCQHSSSGSSHGGSTTSLNEPEDMDSADCIIATYAGNAQHRKRKYNESRLLDSDYSSSVSSNGGGVCDANSRKRIAYDYALTPRSTQSCNALVLATSPNSQLVLSATGSPLGRGTPRPLIPSRENPPPDMQNWLTQFQRWSHVDRLHALDRLIEHCEPQQVRHMMKVIEPQFQRDFISLLPRELALQVLAYLGPKDLLRAAQTCRSWRFLCDDNLLWKEKCRKAQILTEPCADRPKRGRAGNMPPIASPWKAAYMRQHIIEMNWRSRPIREPKVLKGHDDHVITCLQFSGNRIVSGSDDNTLKVWSAVSGKCLLTLVGHTGGVWSSQMSGKIIISGSTDRTLKVWNIDTGECIHTLLGHTSTVRCMHLHGNKVVSGSRDATLRVWDIKQGSCLHVLVGHLAAVRCVQYDGKLIVSGAYDYMVKIWHPERQECLHTLQGHTNRVYSLQFDGMHVVSGSLDTSIRVWDAETGNCKHTLMGHQSLTSGMELRNNILVSGNADSTVKVWDIMSGQCLQTLSGPNKHQSAVTCLQFNSRFVVTSSDDGTVKLWDVKTGDFIRNLVSLESGGSGGVVWRIRANDTKLICAVGSRNGTEETKLMVLDFDVEGACVKCS